MKELRGEVSISDLALKLWDAKFRIFFLALPLVLLAAAVSYLSPAQFRSEIVAVDRARYDDQPTGVQSGALASVAALSSFIGGGGSGTSAELAVEILQSRQFLYWFASRNDVAVPLFASDGWDSELERLQINPDMFDVTKATWKFNELGGKSYEPDREEVYAKLKEEVIDIDFDSKLGMLRLSVTAPSPQLARNWASDIVDAVNEYMREIDKDNISTKLLYLAQKAETVESTEIQGVLYELIESYLKKQMFVNVSNEYVFRVIDEPYLPRGPLEGNFPLYLLVSIALAAIVTMVWEAFKLVIVRDGD